MKTYKTFAWHALFFPFLAIFLSNTAIATAEKTELEMFVEAWLIDSCDTGKEGEPEKRLKEFGLAAEALLLSALEKGPDKALLKDFEKTLGFRWKRRKEVLGQDKGKALGASNLKAIRKVPKDKYVARQMASFVLRVRDRAIQGVSIVGKDKSREVLKRLSKDKTFPLQGAARKAFERLGQ